MGDNETNNLLEDELFEGVPQQIVERPGEDSSELDALAAIPEIVERHQLELRRKPDGSLDEVVVKDVAMFHAEMLDADRLWFACYLSNGERIAFDVVATGGVLKYEVTELPERPDPAA